MKRELLKQIEETQVISFDIFDTLIMRKTLYPEDVFDIIQEKAERQGIAIKDFKSLRQRADTENPCILPDIYQIYAHLQFISGIQAQERNRLLEIELETEKEVLLVREEMREIFEFALKKGRLVYLISDMYLPKREIEEILGKLGITGYRDIFVSCDYKKSKNGGLYQEFIKKVPAQNYLHIGDNPISDGMRAKEAGMFSWQIESGLSLLERSVYRGILKNADTLGSRLEIGLMVSRIFNSPFIPIGKDGRPRIENGMDMIYGLVAPFIAKFVLWLIAEIEKKHYDNILFAARDGFLIQKLYLIYKEENQLDLPSGIYFLTSRTLCAAAAMNSERDIELLVKRDFSGTPEEMLARRFLLNPEQIKPYDKKMNMAEYALLHKEKIYKKSKEVKKQYLKYMEEAGLKKNGRYALFDFVSSGTSQYFLEKIVPFQLEGKYFCWYQRHDGYAEDFNKMDINALKKDYCEDYITGNYFLHYLWLEAIFTSLQPSISGIEDDGFLYDAESRSEEELCYVQQMQRTIEKYFREYIRYSYIMKKSLTDNTTEQLFDFIGLDYTDDESELFKSIHLKDDFDQNMMTVRR